MRLREKVQGGLEKFIDPSAGSQIEQELAALGAEQEDLIEKELLEGKDFSGRLQEIQGRIRELEVNRGLLDRKRSKAQELLRAARAEEAKAAFAKLVAKRARRYEEAFLPALRAFSASPCRSTWAGLMEAFTELHGLEQEAQRAAEVAGEELGRLRHSPFSPKAYELRLLPAKLGLHRYAAVSVSARFLPITLDRMGEIWTALDRLGEVLAAGGKRELELSEASAEVGK